MVWPIVLQAWRVGCRALICAAALSVCVGLISTVAVAQPLPSPAALRSNGRTAGRTAAGGVWRGSAPSQDRMATVDSASWWAPVASLAVPGAGQFLLGQQRSVAYLVADAYLLIQAVSAQREGDRGRDSYRALAADVARRSFGTDRPVGGWDYYELLEKYLESGAYDRIPGGAVDPETDEATFNGASWLLARQTFWRDPKVPPAVASAEYQRALAFYVGRAVPDGYRWSWRDAQLQQDVYKQTIASANLRYQRAVTMAGLLGANHVISAIDAYVTVRIRRFGGVRVGALTLDGLQSSVRPVGDLARGHREWRTALRFIPTRR